MALAVEDAGQDALGHRHRLDFLARDAGELLLFLTVELGFGKGGIQDDIGKEVERLVEVLYQRAHRDARHIQVRAGAERGAETLERLRYLDGAA